MKKSLLAIALAAATMPFTFAQAPSSPSDQKTETTAPAKHSKKHTKKHKKSANTGSETGAAPASSDKK